MQTMLKPEMLSTEVKEDLNLSPSTSRKKPSHMLAEVDHDEHQDIREPVRQANLTSPSLEKLRKIAETDNSYSLREGYLFHEKRLVVPDCDNLRVKLTNHIHRQPAVGHPGRNRTFRLLQRRFY
jgi:hypothetical protein